MSEAEDIGAYGCLAVLGLMVCGVLYSVYALYDGYYSRELPADQTALIDNASGFIINGIKGAQSVKVTLSNKSEWIITSATVSFRFEPHGGTGMVRSAPIGLYPPMLWENGKLVPEELIVLPNEIAVFSVGPYSTKFTAAEMDMRLKVYGHRRIIRLVKIPAQYLMNLWPKVKGLFERE